MKLTRRARRRWVTVAALAALSATVTACGNAGQAPIGLAGSSTAGVSATAIRVGGIAAVTGPLGNEYAGAFQGAEAYFAMVNAAGGVDGRKIQLVSRLDDSTDPSSDVSAARQLVDGEHVFAVVPVATPVFAGGQYLASKGVPTFGWNVNPEWALGPTMFGHDGSYLAPAGIDVAGPWLAHQLGLRRVAVLAYSVTQSAQCAQGQQRSFRKYGFDVVLDDSSVPVGAVNLEADVARIQRAGAQLVVSCMDTTANTAVSDALRRAGLTQVAQYWLDGYDQQALAKFPRQYEGIYTTTDFVPFEEASGSPGLRQYLHQVAALFPGVKPSQQSLAGWISAAMFVQGLRKAGRNLTRQRLVSAVNSFTAFTADGIETPVDWPTDHTSAGPYNCSAYLQARNGHFVPVFHRPFVCLPNGAANLAQLHQIPVPGLPGSSSAGS